MKIFMKKHIKQTIKAPINMQRVAMLLVLILVFSCKSQEKGQKSTEMDSSQQNNLNLLVSDSYGGTELPEFQVIRKEAVLKRIFADINKTRKPGIPMPKVDFEKEMVVIYCEGKVKGKSPRNLAMAAATPDTLFLTSMEGPELSEGSSTAVTMPFSLYKLPLTDKEIVLRRQK